MRSFSFLLSSIESELIFRSEPSPLCLNEIESFIPDKNLTSFTVFADEEFNIGVAWYCKDGNSGSIFRIDPKYGKSEEFINSSLQAFKKSAKAAAGWSSKYGSKMINKNSRLVDELSNEILSIDPKAFESINYYWPVLIDHIRTYVSDHDEEQEFKFEVT